VVVVVVVVAAAVAVALVVVMRQRAFWAGISKSKKQTADLGGTIRDQRSWAKGNSPPLLYASHTSGRRPRTPG